MDKKPFNGLLHILIKKDNKTVYHDSLKSFPVRVDSNEQADICLPEEDLNGVSVEIRQVNGAVFVVNEQNKPVFKIQGKKYKKIKVKKEVWMDLGPYSFSFKLEKIADQSEVLGKSAVIERGSLPIESAPPIPKPKLVKPTLAKKQKPSTDDDKTIVTATNKKAIPPRINVTKIVNEKSVTNAEQFNDEKSIIRWGNSSAVDTFNLNAGNENLLSQPMRNVVAEAILTWKGQIYDVRTYRAGEPITVGQDRNKDLYMPTQKNSRKIASFDGKYLNCYIGRNSRGYLQPYQGQKMQLEELAPTKSSLRKGQKLQVQLKDLDCLNFEFRNETSIHLRYAPAPRQLSKRSMTEPDELMKKTFMSSGIIHLVVLIMIFMLAPAQKKIKIKQVPDRIAKLLVKKPEPPKPKPKPKKVVKKEKPKPKPKKIVEKPKPKPKKKPPRKIVKKKQPKPKKVVVKPNKRIKVVNNKPFVRKPKSAGKMKKPGPPVKTAARLNPKPAKRPDVNKMGALAALGELAPKKSATGKIPPVTINDGGKAKPGSKLSTSGVISSIKSAEVSVPESSGRVNTKGKGFGDPKGYSVKGVGGKAGGRAVAGQVVGNPKLMQISKTEGLTRAQVMAVVKKYVGKIQQCYERSLLSNPGLAGRAEYTWKINPGGTVVDAKVKRTDMSNADQLNSCVLAIFRSMKFPVAKNGESTQPNIGFPFGRL